MPEFSYKAKAGPNQTIEGRTEAETQRSALSKLTQTGYFPLTIEKISEDERKDRKGLWFFKKVRLKELSIFTRQLSDLLYSGLPLLGALRILERQTENTHFRRIIEDLYFQLKRGNRLSEAMGSYPRIFSPLYVSMIKSGEVSGALEEVLERLADFLEREDDIKKRIRSAMAYPILIAVVSISTVILLLTFVVPKLASMFEEMGQSLPLPTRVLLQTSRFLSGYGWLIGLVVFVGFVVFRYRIRRERTISTFDRLKLRLPVIGNLIKRLEIARFSRTLSILLNNGVPMLQSLEITKETVQNRALSVTFDQIRREVAQGKSLGESLRRCPYFPSLVTNMISVGEESNRLEHVLGRVASAYDRDADASIKVLTSLIEPIMILVMGTIVAFVVLSMMLPIFQIDLMVR